MPRLLFGLIVLLLLNWPPAVGAQEAPASAKERRVEELAKQARPALVVIRHAGRDGRQQGLGSGFIIGADGLIATNLHVIGQARPITVQLENGKEYPVRTVYASDRLLDLALLKIDARDLPLLELGDSDAVRDGQSVVALGHPRGLRHSIVSGVISGRPTIEGRPMLQLAIPIEAGNSGGPVLDEQGRVQGIVTLKSQVTANLGFAMPVNELKKLLRRPNPIPIERWVTIGTLNPEEWEPLFEGRWRQRNGRLLIDGPGAGFGGRSLCLARSQPPAVPFEVAVTVRLEDEAGAAGLVFHADGQDKHYGFYPSSGKLRLSRFMGPDVFSWQVLYEQPSSHYRRGDWNTLKVRVEKDKIRCYVNDHLVVESTDQRLTGGRVGLAKFRTTCAEFKNFRVGKELPPAHPPAPLVEKVAQLTAQLEPGATLTPKIVAALAEHGGDSLQALREKVDALERQADQLRKLAKAVHVREVLNELDRLMQQKEEKLDLLHAALLIARLDNEELDVSAYLRQWEHLLREIKAALPDKASEAAILAALNKELFEERGFHGSRNDYYNRANSYLNRVLDDREGIPITLAVLYMELGRRLGLKMAGVGLPGHFVVQHQPKQGQPILIDVYESGKTLRRADAEATVKRITGEGLREEDLAPVTKKAILVRILHNLAGAAHEEEDLPALLRYMDAIVVIAPELSEERLRRAAVRYQTGDRPGAVEDLDWLLNNDPPGLNRDRVQQLRRILSREE